MRRSEAQPPPRWSWRIIVAVIVAVLGGAYGGYEYTRRHDRTEGAAAPARVATAAEQPPLASSSSRPPPQAAPPRTPIAAPSPGPSVPEERARQELEAKERLRSCLASSKCTLVPVFFGSDRKRRDQPLRVDFGAGRDSSLHLGQALITVPRGVSRKVGSIPRPTWFDQYVRGTPAAGDPSRHFTIAPDGIKLYSSEQEFLAAVAAYIKEPGSFKDHAFVFIHGANTTFEFALYRTAQIAYDLGSDGEPFGTSFLFSWPSSGGIESYAYDLDSARFAVDHLADFIRTVMERTSAKHIHVVAHSMGNWPTLVALGQVSRSPKKAKLSQVVLAAPDVDAEEFTRMVAKVVPSAKGLTLYASSSDAAMIASRKLRKDTFRAGDVPPTGPIVIRGMDTIDVTLVGTDVFSLAHSEYAEKRELLNDIALLFRKGERPPNSRTPILQSVKLSDKQYWRFPAN